LLGRNPDNDFPIEHPSVSSSHCQITVSGTGVRLKDLGSTGGTFIEGELVEEGNLKTGQTVLLGSVAMRFETDPEEGAGQTPASTTHTASTAGTSGPLVLGFCKLHRQMPARFACPKCARDLCDFCLSSRCEGVAVRKFCRACGSECRPVQGRRQAAHPQSGFLALLPTTLGYPFKGGGVVLLLAGTAFFFLVGSLPLIGFLLMGYLFNYAKLIITSTAAGRAEPPDWPDYTDWKDDLLVPYGQFLALVLLCLGPFFVLGIWHPADETTARSVKFLALGFGALLAPMGMLALAMFDTIAALNPIALLWSIFRIRLHYLVAAAAFEIVLVTQLVAERYLRALLPVPLLPGVASAFLLLYLVLVSMRILGLLFLTQRDRLGWFSR
jgi:hypothetical protein